MIDDDRAKFVIAQYLIEEGREAEARQLLRELDLPLAQAWADRLEAGEPIDTGDIRWEPDMVRPMPLPEPRPFKFKPFRALMVLMMLFSLVLPIIQMITYRPYTPETAQIQARGAARMRVQALCNVLVRDAIAENRLDGTISCMEWSFSLTDAMLNDAQRCHVWAGSHNPTFTECVLESGIFPEGIRLQGYNF